MNATFIPLGVLLFSVLKERCRKNGKPYYLTFQASFPGDESFKSRHLCLCMYVPVYVCMYVCMCPCMYVPLKYAHMCYNSHYTR
jgi:hypothetical protein